MTSLSSARNWAALAGVAVGVALATFLAGLQTGWFTGTDAKAADRPQDTVNESPSDSSAPVVLDEGESWATEDFPVNDDGLTYGSAAEALTSEEAPDLVAVVGDDGSLGFVTNDDLFAGEEVSSPEEALQYERELAEHGPPTIPVYDLEGNEISEFTLEMGTTGTVRSEP